MLGRGLRMGKERSGESWWLEGGSHKRVRKRKSQALCIVKHRRLHTFCYNSTRADALRVWHRLTSACVSFTHEGTPLGRSWMLLANVRQRQGRSQLLASMHAG